MAPNVSPEVHPMRIVITGATGGIGTYLTRTLAKKHDIVGVVRSTLPVTTPGSKVQYVASPDREGLAKAVHESDIVIHSAIDWKAKSKDFIPANRALTQDILSLSLQARSKLFIYFSSMVV